MRVVLLALLLSTACCGPTIVHSPDATPEPIDGSRCAGAEAHLIAMGCPEQKSPKGTPYGDVCRNAAESGIDLYSCPTAATSCAEVRACR